MRIAVYHNQPSGGARRALIGFVQELGKRHRVDAYTLTTADHVMLRDEDVFHSVTRLPYSRRMPIRFGLYLNDIRRRRDLADLNQVSRQAAQLIDSGGYDCALVDACRFTNTPYVLWHLRTPSAYYFHHRLIRTGERTYAAPETRYERLRRMWHQPLESRLRRRMTHEERELVGRARLLLTNSEYSRGRLLEAYGLTAVVCPPGVDMPVESVGPQGNYLLSVGTLEVHKGFDLVIEAVGRLPRRGRPELLIIANDGHPGVRRALQALAQQLGVQLVIKVMPSQDELSAAYRGALLFLYAAAGEPLGLSALEAMAHGCPVVAVADGGVMETVSDGITGLLVSRNPTQFAAAVEHLLRSQAERRAMGAAARELIRMRWAWPLRASSLEAQLATLRAA